MDNTQVYDFEKGMRPEQTIPTFNEPMDDKIEIIIVHKDRPEYLNMTLQSIAVVTLNSNFGITVVDNGSGQASQDYLDKLEGEVKVIRNEKNLWWSKAANIGAKAADPSVKYFVFMHPDVIIVNPNWLDLLVGVSVSKSSGMVGIEMSNYGVQDRPTQFVNELCVLLTRECYRECGGWSEELPQVGAPFIMTYAAQVKGFNPQAVKNKVLHHFKVFAMDYSVYEDFTQKARAAIPGILRDIQGMPRKR